MALTELYIDPSIAGNSGAGTVGDPYGDVEWAVKQANMPVGGVRLNVKSGTAEVLVAALNTAMADTSEAGKTVAWVPTETGPLIVQGYTASQGDGGKGSISGGGSVSIMTSTSYVMFVDMILHNTGSGARLLQLNNWSWVIRCELHTSTNVTGVLALGIASGVIDSYFHDYSGAAIELNEAYCARNYITSSAGVNKVLVGCSGACYVVDNIFDVSNITDAALSLHDGGVANNNSFYNSVAGTKYAIQVAASTIGGSITNNIIEGWSGVGGIGIKIDGSQSGIRHIGGNAFFNCETEISAPSLWTVLDIGDDETLLVSAFTDAPNADFSTIDTGNIKAGALPKTFGDGAI